MTVVKVCGITDLEAGCTAVRHGASYLGFVFFPPSTRNLEPEEGARLIAELRAATAPSWKAVGVFVNEPLERIQEITTLCGLDVVQLNGEEPPEYVAQVAAPVFKAVKVGTLNPTGAPPRREDFGAERLLLDANVPGRYGGTGLTYNWSEVRLVVSAGFLAGGLTPTNVRQAITEARPWGVDVSSGVETEGAKDPELIRAFLDAVATADSAVLR